MILMGNLNLKGVFILKLKFKFIFALALAVFISAQGVITAEAKAVDVEQNIVGVLSRMNMTQEEFLA